jgi:hypothetical protein
MNARNVVLGLAALVAGCATASKATSSSPPAVSDEDFARLQSGQMGPVNQARELLNSAQDQHARAKLGVQQAQNEQQLAKTDEEAAKAGKDFADERAKISDQTRDPAQMNQTKALYDKADKEQRVAEAHVNYATNMMTARQSALDAADKQVKLGEARVELAKVQALQKANNPAASKYDLGTFQKQVDQAKRDYDGAIQKKLELEASAAVSQRAFQNARHQAQGRAAPPQHGTAGP